MGTTFSDGEEVLATCESALMRAELGPLWQLSDGLNLVDVYSCIRAVYIVRL